MKPQIIQAIGDNLAGRTQSEALELIDAYFGEITWSLEKEEWDRMSESQKIAFVDKARKK